MVMVARRYFAPTTFLRALEGDPRTTRLYGFVSTLLSCSRTDESLYGGSLIVDATRAQLAETCGVSSRTIQRWERDLAEAGFVRVLHRTRNRRVIELVEPTVDAPDRANRAVDNCPARRAGVGVQLDTSVLLSRTQVSNSSGPLPIPVKGGERSRLARAHAEAGSTQAPTRSADDLATHVARGIMLEVTRRLEADAPNVPLRARTLSRRQASEVQGAIERRVRIRQSDGAGELALTLTRSDVDRVLGYSLRAARPAAHLHRSLVGGDWRSAAAPASEAAAVAARGPEAEIPVAQDARAGPSWSSPSEATAAESARLERALNNVGATEAQRAVARRVQGSTAVVQLAQRLELVVLKGLSSGCCRDRPAALPPQSAAAINRLAATSSRQAGSQVPCCGTRIGTQIHALQSHVACR